MPGPWRIELWRWRTGGRGSAGPATRASPAGPAAAARGRRPGKALDRAAHQLDRADARVDDVLERGLGALIRHAAIAVGDRADLHAIDPRIRLRLGEGAEDRFRPRQHRRRR